VAILTTENAESALRIEADIGPWLRPVQYERKPGPEGNARIIKQKDLITKNNFIAFVSLRENISQKRALNFKALSYLFIVNTDEIP